MSGPPKHSNFVISGSRLKSVLPWTLLTTNHLLRMTYDSEVFTFFSRVFYFLVVMTLKGGDWRRISYRIHCRYSVLLHSFVVHRDPSLCLLIVNVTPPMNSLTKDSTDLDMWLSFPLVQLPVTLVFVSRPDHGVSDRSHGGGPSRSFSLGVERRTPLFLPFVPGYKIEKVLDRSPDRRQSGVIRTWDVQDPLTPDDSYFFSTQRTMTRCPGYLVCLRLYRDAE